MVIPQTPKQNQVFSNNNQENKKECSNKTLISIKLTGKIKDHIGKMMIVIPT